MHLFFNYLFVYLFHYLYSFAVNISNLPEFLFWSIVSRILEVTLTAMKVNHWKEKSYKWTWYCST